MQHVQTSVKCGESILANGTRKNGTMHIKLRNSIYFRTDQFDLKCQSDLLTLNVVQLDEWNLG